MNAQQMGATPHALKAALIIQSLIFQIAFGIAALVIASQNINPSPLCARASTFLDLSAWLLGFGVAK
jgi:hypothetical protein